MEAIDTLINREHKRVIYAIHGSAITSRIDEYGDEWLIYVAPMGKGTMSKCFTNEGLDWEQHKVDGSVSDMRDYFFNLFYSTAK